jgi:F0F1-type ATP synthase membrane subunit b/b'
VEAPVSSQVAVANVDDLARRMEQLVGTGGSRPVADDPVRAQFELQRAVIARANDLAAATTSVAAETTQTSPTTTDAPQQDAPMEDPMQQPTDATPVHDEALPATTQVDDIEARLDAALQAVPVATPAPVVGSDTVTLAPTAPAPAPAPVSAAAPAVAQQQQVESTYDDAVFVPVAAPSDLAGPGDATLRLGIDVDRVVQAIEDEALAVQRRIELEMSHAHARAEEIVDQAEVEAERIREHGQSQARVLLGEVEEIISEAQQTGEQILHRANEEASSMRADATNVLQQAQLEARTIVETARREGEQVLAEQRRLATVRAQEAMREQERLKDQIRRLEERRRQVLESLEPLISQLTQMMPAGAVQQGALTPQNVVQLQRQPAAQQQR